MSDRKPSIKHKERTTDVQESNKKKTSGQIKTLLSKKEFGYTTEKLMLEIENF